MDDRFKVEVGMEIEVMKLVGIQQSVEEIWGRQLKCNRKLKFLVEKVARARVRYLYGTDSDNILRER